MLFPGPKNLSINQVIRMDKEATSLQVFPPSEQWKADVLQWMSGLPLALENDETRY